ncbi:hypothetical protein CSQ85_04200 [Bifidobacterium rousetti]|nr:hypothetical protein CSQ85_04200 [Bifidobacterium rousetti]
MGFPRESLEKYDRLQPPEGARIVVESNPLRYLSDMNKVAEAVSQRMGERGLDAVRLAAMACVSVDVVTDMLGEKPVPIADARAVLDALGIRSHVFPIEYAIEREPGR